MGLSYHALSYRVCFVSGHAGISQARPVQARAGGEPLAPKSSLVGPSH